MRKPHRKSSELLMIDFKNDAYEDEYGCLNWRWGCSSTGYAKIAIGKGKEMSGHRLVWVLRKGEIPKDMLILHNCYNKRCININHLRLGTYQENNQDKDMGKLSKEDVLLIQKMLLSRRYTQYEIADEFGISQNIVSLINLGKIWNNITDNIEQVSYGLTAQDIKDIRVLVEEGAKQIDVAKMYNISTASVSRIYNRKRRNRIA